MEDGTPLTLGAPMTIVAGSQSTRSARLAEHGGSTVDDALTGLLPAHPRLQDVEQAKEKLTTFLDTAPPELQEWARLRRNAAEDAVARFSVADLSEDEPGEDEQPPTRRPAVRTAGKGRPRRKLLILAMCVLVPAGIFGVYQMDGPAPAAPAGMSAAGDTGQEAAAAQGAAPMDAAQLKARADELRAAVAKNPNDVDTRLTLGVVLFNQSDLAGAEEQWLKAAELAPDQAEAYFNLGFLYLSTTPAQTDKAQAAWDKVVELEPDSQMAATAQSHQQGIDSGTMGGDTQPEAGQPDASQPDAGQAPLGPAAAEN